MKRKSRRRKCLHCRELFRPDSRNRWHQKYCQDSMCQRVSHRASHRRWKNRKGNRDYCRSEDKKRVRNWRERHAGYWKKKALGGDGEAKAKLAKEQPVDRQEDKVEQRSRNATKGRGGTLRDFDMMEDPVIVGLIAMLTGGTLRDDIAATMDKMVIQGRNILGHEASV